MYQIYNRDPPTIERSFVRMFRQSVLAYEPLATKERLLGDTFNKKLIIAYGDDDWTPAIDQKAAQQIVNRLNNGS